MVYIRFSLLILYNWTSLPFDQYLPLPPPPHPQCSTLYFCVIDFLLVAHLIEIMPFFFFFFSFFLCLAYFS